MILSEGPSTPKNKHARNSSHKYDSIEVNSEKKYRGSLKRDVDIAPSRAQKEHFKNLKSTGIEDMNHEMENFVLKSQGKFFDKAKE